MSDTSSSPNLLDKDNDDEDPSTDVDEDPSTDVDEEEEDDDDPSADVDEEEEEDDDLLDEEDESSDEVNVEAIIEKKGRSRFQWSHTADCIVDNNNSKDEALIQILLAKEPWNAGHGQVMKAWQNLLGIVLEMVVDGDKIFQGVSEAMLKKRYQLYLDIGKKWETEKEKRNQPENEEEKQDLNISMAQLIHRGIEDLWEEFIMHKENEKEKKAEDSQKETIAKEGAEKIRQFVLGKLRKHDAKGSQKDKDVDIDCNLQTQKHHSIDLRLLFRVHLVTTD